MITYTNCPICKSTALHAVFSAKDHTVSQLSFVIMQCGGCTLRFTQDVPSQQNIGKYYASENYISHSNTQKGFINRMYHIVRKHTLITKKNLIKKETGRSSGKILDIGCGAGAFLNTMRQSSWDITGLEPDETARNKAAELYNIVPQSSEDIYSLPHNNYDAITMWHVLEHVHDLQKYTAQLKNMITPGGKIFIAVPNYTSYDAQHYQSNWAAYDVPRHLYHFSPKSMAELMMQHGLAIKKIKPMWFDSYYVSLHSEKFKTGTGNFIKAIFTGFISNNKAIVKNDKCSSVIYVISRA